MIFASVGSMLPFDRLVRAVDTWAGAHPEMPVFLQIGQGEYEPKHAEFARIVTPADYTRRVKDARLFVAHAGMGSILQALEAGTPILVTPRDPALKEITNDHQAATIANFGNRPGIAVAKTVQALPAAIDAALAAGSSGGSLSSAAPAPFLEKIAAFIAA
ncbi:MAG TPA: glycosyltransferase [Sphingomonas sp.]|nr:glycosyltransferase [Sphingomonas sp.]